ncbi:MAG TPA: FtsX-like permease family protein [Syntrophorhabdaceae bacterium]|nr:FtsX-like permease family protein [Syntrophorhabdaceae bacterium]
MKIVIKAFLRYLLRRRSLSVLQLLGIACGVAAVVGMTLSAKSALSSFNEAVEFLRGKATHLIERPAGPMEEDIIAKIMHDPAVDFLAPTIDRRIRLTNDGDLIRVLGIELFLDRTIRPEITRAVRSEEKGISRDEFFDFLLNDKSVFIDRNLATQLKISKGNTLETSRGSFNVVGIFSNPTGEPLILMDIGNAQRLFNMNGNIDRIDLILNDESAFRSRWETGFKIESNRQRMETLTALLGAFRLNLQALSLLALFVGVFLIYNTAMFTVVNRRRDAGIMRSLGANRNEILGAFLSEILLFGITGGAIGSVLGYLLSRFLTGLMGSTISSLYFFLSPSPLSWSWWNIVAGILLGCGASILGSVSPLIELIRTEPAITTYGRTYHRISSKTVKKITLIGLGIIMLSVLLLGMSYLHVYVGFAGTFVFLLGVSHLTGLILVVIIPPMINLFNLIGKTAGKIAAGNILLNMNRTSIAVAAFMIALSMSIGLGSLINSFRQSLIWWMNSQLRGDIYISTRGDVEVPLDFYEELRKIKGIGGIDIFRTLQITYNNIPAYITAIDASVLQKYARFGWVKGGDENWEPVKTGSVIVSESFARRFNIKKGDTVYVKGINGTSPLSVAAVFYDYASEHGVIMMDRSIFIKLFNDRTINSLGIFIDTTQQDKQTIIKEVKRRAKNRGLPTSTRDQFHSRILSVFDNTFAVTSSMRIIAIIVAFFGIAGALMTLFVERQREFGIYRALGFSTKQIASITLLEGIGMGIISFVMSIGTGTALAFILIKVINLRSFNWTIFYHFSMNPYIVTLLTALFASIGACIYPLWKVFRTYPEMQIREE